MKIVWITYQQPLNKRYKNLPHVKEPVTEEPVMLGYFLLGIEVSIEDRFYCPVKLW